jgi:hypothetical protein
VRPQLLTSERQVDGVNHVRRLRETLRETQAPGTSVGRWVSGLQAAHKPVSFKEDKKDRLNVVYATLACSLVQRPDIYR